MLRVLVCSCSFRFYPLVGVSPCGWCRSLLFCDVLFVCVAGSVTVLTVGCCYTADWVFCLLCEAGSFTVLWLFTAMHLCYLLDLYCVLPFLYSKRNVLFTLYVRTGLFLLCAEGTTTKKTQPHRKHHHTEDTHTQKTPPHRRNKPERTYSLNNTVRLWMKFVDKMKGVRNLVFLPNTQHVRD